MQKRLSEVVVPAAIQYPVPIKEQPAYKHLCCPYCAPIDQDAAKRVISLPMSLALPAQYQDKIIGALLL